MKIEFVLDASAILAAIQAEPGSAKVAAMLGRAAVSAVNVAEVVTKLLRVGQTEAAAYEDLAALRLEIIPFDRALAHKTASLCPKTSRIGLSLGDRACLATAEQLGVPAVTTDRTWKTVRLGIRVLVVR